MITDNKTEAWVYVVDESITADVARNMNLLLQCGNDFFSAALLDTDRNKFVALVDFRFQFPLNATDLIQKILHVIEKNKPIFDNRYDTVTLAFSGFKNTLLPDVFFNSAHMKTLFEANHLLDDSETLCYDNIRRNASKNMYAIPTELLSFFNAYYDNIAIYHAATPLLEGILTQHKNVQELMVTVNVQHTFFEMVVNKSSNLIFYNQFNYHTVEDFIYYIVFVYEQLGLNPEMQVLNIAGMMEKNSMLLAMAQKYIRNIQFVPRPSFSFYSYGFDDVAAHYHFSLFNQFLCV
jgi:hypothetical protein